MKALLLLTPRSLTALLKPPLSDRAFSTAAPSEAQGDPGGGTRRAQGNSGWQQLHREWADVIQEHRFRRGCHQSTCGPGTPAEVLYAVDAPNKYKSFSSARYPPLLIFSRIYTASTSTAQNLIFLVDQAASRSNWATKADRKLPFLTSYKCSAVLGKITRESYQLCNKIRQIFVNIKG